MIRATLAALACSAALTSVGADAKAHVHGATMHPAGASDLEHARRAWRTPPYARVRSGDLSPCPSGRRPSDLDAYTHGGRSVRAWVHGVHIHTRGSAIVRVWCG